MNVLAAGRAESSDICTHRPCVNPVGTISYVYSTSPRAGIATGFGIFTTRSGCGMFQPSAHWRGGGASSGFPAGAPAVAHDVSVWISCGVNEGSFEKLPNARIGEPRRHFFVARRNRDGAREWPRLLVRDERHRRDFAGPVAALAMLLQNRQHVAIENGCVGCSGAAKQPVLGETSPPQRSTSNKRDRQSEDRSRKPHEECVVAHQD